MSFFLWILCNLYLAIDKRIFIEIDYNDYVLIPTHKKLYIIKNIFPLEDNFLFERLLQLYHVCQLMHLMVILLTNLSWCNAVNKLKSIRIPWHLLSVFTCRSYIRFYSIFYRDSFVTSRIDIQKWNYLSLYINIYIYWTIKLIICNP